MAKIKNLDAELQNADHEEDPAYIDPETGEIKGELTEAQREQLKQLRETMKKQINESEAGVKLKRHNEAISERLNKIITDIIPTEWREQWATVSKNILALNNLSNEIDTLEPYLNAELEKQGTTLDELLESVTAGELLQLANDKDSFFSKALEAARKRHETIQSQQQGREQRAAAKQQAQETNAVMQIKQDKYSFFSQRELWDAFAPGRICKMGTLSKDFIDEKTGRIRKVDFDDGEIEPLNATEISYKAFTLLNSIMANTVENIREKPIKNGEIRFYVKGVLDSLTDDPRTLHDDQITLDRKTAGALYLEKLFEPLQGYIGTTLNGSRYSVFNYIGYDFETDTMIVQLPYLYELWKSTQRDYFIGKRNKQKAIEENKRPKKADVTPLKVNQFFKGKAYSADETTLEIAVYITNMLLLSGKKGNKKRKTEINYKTLIKDCPRLKNKLEEIENDTTLKNPSSRYNAELKKISRAFDLILNTEKCDALNYYEIIDIRPAEIISKGKRKGETRFIPPTKKKLDGKLTIVWCSKPDDDLQ